VLTEDQSEEDCRLAQLAQEREAARREAEIKEELWRKLGFAADASVLDRRRPASLLNRAWERTRTKPDADLDAAGAADHGGGCDEVHQEAAQGEHGQGLAMGRGVIQAPLRIFYMDHH
jgi:hypothetical protein